MAWYDAAVTEANVLATLRLGTTDPDAALIAAKIPAAAKAIEKHLDRVNQIDGPPPEPALQEVLEGVTIKLYHRAAVVATIGAGVATFDVSGEGFDPLTDFYVELSPFKEQWGIG